MLKNCWNFQVLMAKLRPRQLEPSKAGPSKLGFDGEEDGWVLVKRQRVIIVLPPLPLPDNFTTEKPETFQSQAELRDGVADLQETVLPSLPPPQHFILEKPQSSPIADIHDDKTTSLHTVVPEEFITQKPSHSQAELRDGIVDTRKNTLVVPSLPVAEHYTLHKTATSQSLAELRDRVVDTRNNTPAHTVLPSLLVPEKYTLQKPASSQSRAELRDGVALTERAASVHIVAPSLPGTSQPRTEFRDGIAPKQRAASVHTMVSSLPVTEHYNLQKPGSSQSRAEFRDGIEHTLRAASVHTMAPSLPVTEQNTLQKPGTSQSRTEFRDSIAPTQRAASVHAVAPSLPVNEHYNMQKPVVLQSQAELRADKPLVHTMMPSLPIPDRCTFQKPATSQSQAKPRDFVADAHETTRPDFTSVDKPERVIDRNLLARKAPAVRRSLQDRTVNPDRRVETHRRRTGGHKPIRFARVLCSSVVMDDERLRVLNLERKVEKAGGLNEWVGSIGLGREFERMLKVQRMSKFQLANLTMEKLKLMGALAVGPRRKLIHAIQCAYHPHCLRPSN